MATQNEICGFFDANLVDDAFDRVYIAETFAQYFASFIGNGIFNNNPVINVRVQSTRALGVTVTKGQAWINGYWYKLKEDLDIQLDMADGTRDRIDLIVIRWDKIQRDIYLTTIKGEFSTSPVAPSILRTEDYFDLCLAKVRINRGVINIEQRDITDTRMDNEVCGFVHSVVDQVDTTTLYKQFEDFYNNFVTNVAQAFETWSQEQREAFAEFFQTSRDNFEAFFQSSQADFNEFFQNSQNAFNTWFDSIKDILDESTAGHLLKLIQDENLAFYNKTATFTSDTTYEDYPYKADIPCEGVTTDYIPTVNLSMEDATSGNISPIAVSGDDIVTIYSSENTSITIPTILCTKGGE